MKQGPLLTALLLLWIGYVFNSCAKEYSCENCKEANKPPMGNDPGQPNQPPVARAGADIIYKLPTTSVNVNGSQSYDPDGTIVSYSWKQIDGPNQTNIVSPQNVASEVNTLTGGLYTLELTVADNGGLTSKDTVRIIEDQMCGTNRPQINAELIKIGELSEGREGIIAATALNKILFVGGIGKKDHLFISKNIDIYNYSSNSWSLAELSITRINMGIAVSGNKIFIAGGEAYGQYFSRIDIYDALTNTWSIAELSEARSNVAAVALGDKIYFAGGNRLEGNNMVYSNKVDIYNTTTGIWTSSYISQARSTMVGTAINNQIYFAGGVTNGETLSDQIDIYDARTQIWSTSHLAEPKYFFAGIANKGNIYWAGGYTGTNYNTQEISRMVEIKNAATQSAIITCLSTTRAAASAVLNNGDIIFYDSYPISPWILWNWYSNDFDIYNTATGTWSVGVFRFIPGFQPSIIAAGGQVYVAGGTTKLSGVLTGVLKDVYLLKY